MTTADLQQWQQSLDARVTLQADLTWAGGQDGYVAAGGADSANPFQALWWVLEPIADHCDDCLMLAANSPYDPPWDTSPNANILQTTPGAGATQCGAGCKCSLDYGPTGEQVASWGKWLPEGTPMVGDDDEMTPPTPPARSARGSSGPGYSPYGNLPANGGFTKEQRAALDLYRIAELNWNAVRGDLPELPNFFMLDSVRFSRFAVGYDHLTPAQQQAIDLALEAFFQWKDAAPDDWFEEGEFAELADADAVKLYNPYPRQKGGLFGFGGPGHGAHSVSGHGISERDVSGGAHTGGGSGGTGHGGGGASRGSSGAHGEHREESAKPATDKELAGLHARRAELERQIAKLQPHDAYIDEVARYFPGGRVGGSGRRNPGLNKRREAHLDRTVEAARKAEPLHRELASVNKKIADIESGASAKREARAELVRQTMAKWQDELRTVKPGDYVFHQSYPNSVEVLRVNPKGLSYKVGNTGRESAPFSHFIRVDHERSAKPTEAVKVEDTRVSKSGGRKGKMTDAEKAAAAQVRQGYKDWASGRAFLRNGNYRLYNTDSKGYKTSGSKAAPWNKAVKAAHPDNADFHQAAEAYKAKYPKQIKPVKSGVGRPVGLHETDDIFSPVS